MGCITKCRGDLDRPLSTLTQSTLAYPVIWHRKLDKNTRGAFPGIGDTVVVSPGLAGEFDDTSVLARHYDPHGEGWAMRYDGAGQPIKSEIGCGEDYLSAEFKTIGSADTAVVSMEFIKMRANLLF